MALVLDASMALAWCLSDEMSEVTDRVLRMVESSYAVTAAHWPYEVLNALTVNVRKSRLNTDDAAAFIDRLVQLDIRVEGHGSSLSQELLTLSLSAGLTVYDAAYLDLALQNGLPLASLDRALCRAAALRGVETIPRAD